MLYIAHLRNPYLILVTSTVTSMTCKVGQYCKATNETSTASISEGVASAHARGLPAAAPGCHQSVDSLRVDGIDDPQVPVHRNVTEGIACGSSILILWQPAQELHSGGTSVYLDAQQQRH